ncbi:MAG: OmpH family outer membrane protein [Polaribacter sp.]|nr:OmpH family outer membrane protein [Polaribacter sp.]
MANTFYYWKTVLKNTCLASNRYIFGMVFSKHKLLKMKKVFVLIVLLFTIQNSIAQKGQNLAYIDMEYILENVPEYVTAQSNLNAKVEQWKSKLSKLERYIEVLKTDLANEKAILTKDLIEEREEDITIKKEELARLESLYFGPQGDLFNLRRQLVKPIQDLVYNSVQSIAKRKKYDFVLDKSSELVMLYSNKKYDISELVLASIVKDRKIKTSKNNVSAKKLATQIKTEAIKQARLKKIEDQKKAIQAKRDAKLKERDAKRKLLLDKKNAAKKKTK